ncbi:2TM domain-containing protein [Dyadobacter sp. NIV53]|uniref:2TM domain-containing protein n=1 Tax=Dyadobacter sp. NIV53 TaxID=2861765 RepID=UPI001C88AD12|nr:2TM domain-containing protein [Dyadobacter sp. NIV53]
MEKYILLILGYLNSKKSFRTHLLVFLLVTPAIWLVWHLTGSTFQWHYWVVAAWTKGLQVHFLRAIVSKSETFQKIKLWIGSKIHATA